MAALLLTGCATERPAGTVERATPSPAENLRFHLGTVALAPDSNPAHFSFQKGAGQIDQAGDRAATAAGNMLGTSTSDPLANAIISPITFVLAPLVAADGAIRARKRLNPADLAACETNLTTAMQEAALPQRFHQWLLQAAREKNCRLVSSAAPPRTTPNRNADSVLEARVEELRLERTGSGDSSFALRIKIRTRVVRAADGVVLYDRPAEYRSETGLFVDWTLANVFQKVADTGYRKLAQDIVDQILNTTDDPLLLGAGYGKGAVPELPPAVRFVSHRTPWAQQPTAQLMDDRIYGDGGIAVFSTGRPTEVALQTPLSRESGAVEAIRETEWMLDGLDNHPNLLVMLPACAAAIPISLWKQSAAWVHGVSPAEAREAEGKLREAAGRTPPHQELARLVALQLAPRTSRPVLLADQPWPPPTGLDPAGMRLVSRGAPVGRLVRHASDRNLPGRGTEHALVIQVQSAALTGPRGVNPKLALSVEAEATVLRLADRQPLYSCPVRYRSTGRKFADWAAHDAKSFREELDKCHRELSAGMVNRVLGRGILPPEARPLPTFAKD